MKQELIFEETANEIRGFTNGFMELGENWGNMKLCFALTFDRQIDRVRSSRLVMLPLSYSNQFSGFNTGLAHATKVELVDRYNLHILV